MVNCAVPVADLMLELVFWLSVLTSVVDTLLSAASLLARLCLRPLREQAMRIGKLQRSPDYSLSCKSGIVVFHSLSAQRIVSCHV